MFFLFCNIIFFTSVAYESEILTRFEQAMNHSACKDDKQRYQLASKIIKHHTQDFTDWLTYNQHPLHTRAHAAVLPLFKSSDKKVTKNLQALMRVGTYSQRLELFNIAIQEKATRLTGKLAATLYECKNCYTPSHTIIDDTSRRPCMVCSTCSKKLIQTNVLQSYITKIISSIYTGTSDIQSLVSPAALKSVSAILYQRVRSSKAVKTDTFTGGVRFFKKIFNKLTASELCNNAIIIDIIQHAACYKTEINSSPEQKDCYKTILNLISFLSQNSYFRESLILCNTFYRTSLLDELDD